MTIGKAVVIFVLSVLFITYSLTSNSIGGSGSGSGRGFLLLGGSRVDDLKSHLSFFSRPPPPPTSSSLSLSLSLSCSSTSSSPPLRVFMYNLSNTFNLAMLSPTPIPNPNPNHLPPWPPHPLLQQQHSVEYWMMASLFYHNAFNHNSEALRVDLLAFLRKSKYWQRTCGRDHVIPMHHPNAFRFLRQQLNASILIVADFGRFPPSIANLHKDVVAPYKHVVESFMDDDDDSLNPFKLRTTLLFFRGRTVRKSEGKVRRKLEKLLKGYEDVHFEASYATAEGINASTQGMRSSKFCLHPAGDTPSSNRLFDAIVSHCVPVIVSDHIELPFESELDYTEFSLFFSVNEALVPGYMVEHLRKIPESEWLKMWGRLKEISHHFEYQFPPKKDDAVNMIWRQVRSKVPGERLVVNRKRRLMIPDWW
ncbi:hypothetical protein M8C21_004210 [Ambrosia artemisiifolia]|uniref:Exostosin GT47 domain-containing protein n=1 Tax=Ambrosia artemisiifolia TaxID=4212 RepID=A0AAD5D0B4_AMBAR|nr:hypothetical protein M8C21_004210 [Ambrosia artemisiifolia]